MKKYTVLRDGHWIQLHSVGFYLPWTSKLLVNFKYMWDTHFASSKLCLYKFWHDRIPHLVWDVEWIDSEIFTAYQRSCGKVMFSVVPAIMFRGPIISLSTMRWTLPYRDPSATPMLHPRHGSLLYKNSPDYPSPRQSGHTTSPYRNHPWPQPPGVGPHCAGTFP